MEKVRSVIKAYLDNPNPVYEEWYKKKQLKEWGKIEGELTGVFPPLDKIIEVFDNWKKDNLAILRSKICIEWNYTQKRIEYHDDIDFINNLASFISNVIDFPIEVAIIFFVSGLDLLCSN